MTTSVPGSEATNLKGLGHFDERESGAATTDPARIRLSGKFVL